MTDSTHPAPGATHVLLNDGYTVSPVFYAAIRDQVREALPFLERGKKYTLEILCGDDFWQELTNGERRMAGRCMAQMVANRKLPFQFAHHKHEYPKWYQLK